MMKTNTFAWLNEHSPEDLRFDRIDIPTDQIEAEVSAALAAGLIPEEDRQKATIYLSWLLGMGAMIKRLEVLPWDTERSIQ